MVKKNKHPFGKGELALNFYWLWEALNEKKKDGSAKWRICSLKGGTNSGKSYNSIMVLLLLAVIEKTDILCVSRSIPILKMTIWTDVMKILDDAPSIKAQVTNIHKSDKYIEFENGSKMQFKAYADAQSARGAKFKICFIDEVNGISKEIYDQLSMRSERIICAYNPSHPFWFNEIEDQPNCKTIFSNYKHNPYVSQAIIDHLEGLKHTNPEYYRVYALGLTGAVESLVFQKWDMLTLDDFRALEADYECIGADFGWTDKCAVVHMKIVDDCLYYHQVVYQSKLLNTEVYKLIANYMEIEGLNRNILVVGDSSEPRTIKELKNLGLNIVGAIKKSESVKFLLNKMKQYKIFLTEDSKDIIVEFKSYSLVDGKLKNTHHAIDSMRYALSSKEVKSGKGVRWINPNKQIARMNKQRRMF